MNEQIMQLKEIFFRMGSVIEILNIADLQLDDNQARAAAFCAGTTLAEISMHLHAVTEQLEESALPLPENKLQRA